MRTLSLTTLRRFILPAVLAFGVFSPALAAAAGGSAQTPPVPVKAAPALSPGGQRVIDKFFETNPHYAGSTVSVSQHGASQHITITPTNNNAGGIVRPVLVFKNPTGKWSLTGDNTPPLAMPPKAEAAPIRPISPAKAQRLKAAAEEEAKGLLTAWSKVYGSGGPPRSNARAFELAQKEVANILEELPQASEVSRQTALLRRLSKLGNPIFNDAINSPESFKTWMGNCESATLALMLSAGRGKQYDTFNYTPEIDHLDGGGANNTMRILRANGARTMLLGRTQTSLEGIEAELASAPYKPGQMLALQSMSPTEGHVTVLVMLSDKKWYVVNNQSWYTDNHDLEVAPGKLQTLGEWVEAFQRFGNTHAPPKTAPGTDVKLKWNLITTDLKIPFEKDGAAS